MNIKKIAERLIAMPAPVGFIERMVEDGVPLSELELKDAWNSVLQKLGFGDSPSWMDVGPFILAYNRFGVKLEGAEKWLADIAMDMAREAEAGGYQQMSGIGMSFVSRKTGCAACPAKRRLSRVRILVSGYLAGLRSRRGLAW